MVHFPCHNRPICVKIRYDDFLIRVNKVCTNLVVYWTKTIGYRTKFSHTSVGPHFYSRLRSEVNETKRKKKMMARHGGGQSRSLIRALLHRLSLNRDRSIRTLVNPAQTCKL